ncbi:MAG: hypothetical protein NDJ90_08850 [Oligoflexia bacterium]|nr:hypothetical protein [Oligoflexia bacterium]
MRMRIIPITSIIATLLFGSSALAMGKPQPHDFDPTLWAGDYRIVDPDCRTQVSFYRDSGDIEYVKSVRILATPGEDGPSLEFIGQGESPDLTYSKFFAHINGEPFISANSCFSDGLIFRSTVTANAHELRVLTEKLRPGFLCAVTDHVEDRWETLAAQRNGDSVTVWGCSFRRAAGTS